MLTWLLGCLCRCRPGARRKWETTAPGSPGAGAAAAEETPAAEPGPAVQGLAALRDIPGVGPRTVQHLYDAGYHSVDDVRAASEGALARVPGVSRRLARTIREALA